MKKKTETKIEPAAKAQPHFRKNPRSTRKRSNLTIDPDVWELAQDKAYSEGMSVSEVVNELLKRYGSGTLSGQKHRPGLG